MGRTEARAFVQSEGRNIEPEGVPASQVVPMIAHDHERVSGPGSRCEIGDDAIGRRESFDVARVADASSCAMWSVYVMCITERSYFTVTVQAGGPLAGGILIANLGRSVATVRELAAADESELFECVVGQGCSLSADRCKVDQIDAAFRERKLRTMRGRERCPCR